MISIHHDVCVCVCWTQHNPQLAVFTIHLVRTPPPVLRNLYENYYPRRVDVFPGVRSGDGGGAISLNIIITRTTYVYYYNIYLSNLLLLLLFAFNTVFSGDSIKVRNEICNDKQPWRFSKTIFCTRRRRSVNDTCATVTKYVPTELIRYLSGYLIYYINIMDMRWRPIR